MIPARSTSPDDPFDAAAAQILADKLWQTFSKDDCTLVRFGIFPATKMPELDANGTRLLAVALMDIAKRNGGTRV